jgi:hypothetical protein
MVLSNQDFISNLVQQFLAYNFLKTFKREGSQLPHSSRHEGSLFVDSNMIKTSCPIATSVKRVNT